jgi:hypothetical protein
MDHKPCKALGCSSVLPANHPHDFCALCLKSFSIPVNKTNPALSISDKYPQYYKKVGRLTEIDVYAVHHLFDIQDPSGCIQHASKKLLLSGVRTGGKSAFKDITEARDTLNRWLELNQLVS